MCNHLQYDNYAEEYHLNEEGDMVEVLKVICLDCGRLGEIVIVRPSEPTWLEDIDEVSVKA